MDNNTGLDTKNPLYLELQPLREEARDLHAGSKVVKSKKQKYLFSTKNESINQYNVRLKRAVYDNWLEVVVQTRHALTWKNPVKRENFNSEVEPFIEDVDNKGTEADVFFRRVTESAAVGGLDWVLVDKPPIPEGRELSQREEEELGIRPSFIHLPGESVFDWMVGSDGKLEFAVIASRRALARVPGQPWEFVQQRIVWTRETIETFEKPEGRQSKNKKFESVSIVTNDLGEIPLVPFYGVKVKDWFGVPVTKDIIDHAISIYNKFSDRDVFEFLTNNPITIIIGTEKPDIVQTGSSNGMFINSINATAGRFDAFYLEPSGKGAESSRLSEEDLIRRVFRIALAQAKRESAQVESKAAQREKLRIFDASLSAVAKQNETAEMQCWRFAQAWQSEEEFTGEVSYTRDFDDKVVEAAMITAFSKLVDASQLSRETFLRMLKKGEVLPDDLELEEEINRIRQDQDDLALTVPNSGTEENE